MSSFQEKNVATRIYVMYNNDHQRWQMQEVESINICVENVTIKGKKKCLSRKK